MAESQTDLTKSDKDDLLCVFVVWMEMVSGAAVDAVVDGGSACLQFEICAFFGRKQFFAVCRFGKEGNLPLLFDCREKRRGVFAESEDPCVRKSG